MPFNLSQIFGGWRRKDSKRAPRATSSKGELRLDRETRRSPPSLEGGLSASGTNEASADVARRASQVKNKSELARKLLVSPHISEKATMLGESRHVFKVADHANKSAIKRAVEDRYGVDVFSVNVIAQRDKKRRRGQTLGVKSGFKKAVVKLKEGQTISEF